MVVGGGGGGVRVFGRKFFRKAAKNAKLYTIRRIYNLQIFHSKLVLLSRNPLLALSETFPVERNSSWVGVALSTLVSLSEMSKSVI